MESNGSMPRAENVISFLDTDLYKLTMQCAVLKYFKDVPVTFSFTNRTPEKKLSRKAVRWLDEQIKKLGNMSLSKAEHEFLKTHCPYLTAEYLDFLAGFRLQPQDQVTLRFQPTGVDTGAETDEGDVDIRISGKWVDTILWEVPVLALTSEAYFKFMDTDWNHDGQEEAAYSKGKRLLEAGCIFSDFGTRRRRDYHTQALVNHGLVRASKEAAEEGLPGRFKGTSNVHLSMRFDMAPVGTVAHEWFMGVAAITGDYQAATERALSYWVDCFGEGVLGVALTDTFGTPDFLKAFSQPMARSSKTYAQVFTGVRQDSGDPLNYVSVIRKFYDEQGIKDKKTIVFSDALNVERCIEYKKAAEDHNLLPNFGVGTYFTNDFVHIKTGKKSTPLNIVIKLSSAHGRPAIKISDNAGKNTGDKAEVDKVKKQLGYVEEKWAEGDEASRWGKENMAVTA